MKYMFCNVIIIRPFDQVFTYKLKNGQKVEEGSVVSVPFGKTKIELGIVVQILNEPQKANNYKIKSIEKVHENIVLNKKTLQFIKWISQYTLSPIGLVLKLFLINKSIVNSNDKNKNENKFFFKKVKLNKDQKNASTKIGKVLLKESPPLVLEGVTGSGKTEVFFEAVEKVFLKKKTSINYGSRNFFDPTT